MRTWAVFSAALAPVAVVGGWTVAERLQPNRYSAIRQTISALAAHGATDRWVMTTGLFLLGVCHLVTACGFTEAAVPGRVSLALGGAATVAVAALPQPASGHVVAAGIGFVALALWPIFARIPSRTAGMTVTVILLALLVWLALELRDGSLLGLVERIVVAAETIWPLLAMMFNRLVPGPIRPAGS